jgi:hypothetical protein
VSKTAQILVQFDGARIVVDVSGRRHVSLSTGFTFIREPGVDAELDVDDAVFAATVKGAIRAALETLEGPVNAKRIREIVDGAFELGILALVDREDEDEAAGQRRRRRSSSS